MLTSHKLKPSLLQEWHERSAETSMGNVPTNNRLESVRGVQTGCKRQARAKSKPVYCVYKQPSFRLKGAVLWA